MQSKRLLILLSVVVLIVVVIVVFSAVFAIRDDGVNIVVHNFQGQEIPNSSTAPTKQHVLEYVKGSNIVFLNKQNLLNKLNSDTSLSAWHAFAVVKFPDVIDVHFVERVAFAKMDIGGDEVYIDFVGYVMQDPTDDNGQYLDITSAFDFTSATVQKEVGQPLVFTANTQNSKRLACVLDTLKQLWACYVEVDNFAQILGNQDVFTFDSSENMHIKTKVGTEIIVEEPWNNTSQKVYNAFSVYYNDSENLQQEGVVIVIRKDGRIDEIPAQN